MRLEKAIQEIQGVLSLKEGVKGEFSKLYSSLQADRKALHQAGDWGDALTLSLCVLHAFHQIHGPRHYLSKSYRPFKDYLTSFEVVGLTQDTLTVMHEESNVPVALLPDLKKAIAYMTDHGIVYAAKNRRRSHGGRSASDFMLELIEKYKELKGFDSVGSPAPRPSERVGLDTPESRMVAAPAPAAAPTPTTPRVPPRAGAARRDMSLVMSPTPDAAPAPSPRASGDDAAAPAPAPALASAPSPHASDDDARTQTSVVSDSASSEKQDRKDDAALERSRVHMLNRWLKWTLLMIVPLSIVGAFVSTSHWMALNLVSLNLTATLSLLAVGVLMATVLCVRRARAGSVSPIRLSWTMGLLMFGALGLGMHLFSWMPFVVPAATMPLLWLGVALSVIALTLPLVAMTPSLMIEKVSQAEPMAAERLQGQPARKEADASVQAPDPRVVPVGH